MFWFHKRDINEVEETKQGLEKAVGWTKEKIAALDKPIAMEMPLDKSASKEVSQDSTRLKEAESDKTQLDETEAKEIPEEISELVDAYLNDLKEKSEVPETISDETLEDIEKTSSQEVAAKREEFNDIKSDLKKQWEEKNGMEWPKYDHDVYSSNGKLIRKAGQDYDAHHIQPLSMGGKNEVSNITPLNAEVHYDKQGVHAPNSPYAKLEKTLGE